MSNNVIVLGNNHHNTLGLVRSLGRGGMDVTCLIVSEGLVNSFVGKSKYIKDFRLLPSFDSALSYMKENIPHEEQIPVFTTSDAAAEYLDSHYDELCQHYLVNNCGRKQDGISYWMNKEIMLSKAKECGLVVPSGFHFNTSSDLSTIPEEVVFPCIIKPQKSSLAGKDNFRICNNREQLEVAIREVSVHCQEVMIQEYIKRDYEVLVMGMRSITTKTTVIPGCLHKLRVCQHTKSLGMFAYAYTTRAIDNAIEVESMKRFLDAIDYDGIFSMEFMIANEKAYFLEINLRNDGTQFCFEGAGVNLPLLWIKASKGKDITSDNKSLEKKFCMVEVNYLKNMDWHHPLAAVKEWWNTSLYALWDKKDWKPAFYKLKYAGKKM